jgi:hypothetical protein
MWADPKVRLSAIDAATDPGRPDSDTERTHLPRSAGSLDLRCTATFTSWMSVRGTLNGHRRDVVDVAPPEPWASSQIGRPLRTVALSGAIHTLSCHEHPYDAVCRRPHRIRCSTDKQDLAAQHAALLELGVDEDRIYLDHGLTGTNRDRPGLDQALAAVRAGDTLVVPKLDRPARSVPDARAIGDSLCALTRSRGPSTYSPRCVTPGRH